MRWTEFDVPDKRAHRGRHPEDEVLFAPHQWPRLQEATRDLSWLVGRGYSSVSAVKLVGDRYQLAERQRIAVSRCACSDDARRDRQARCVALADLRGQTVVVDGFNLLTTVEAALSGGVLLLARDGCVRDMASMHGTYRHVNETDAALRLVGDMLTDFGVTDCRWLLDQPVSNSGRLKTRLMDITHAAGWRWTVELVPNPDRVLSSTESVVVSADSVVLDACRRWTNLAASIVRTRIPAATVIDLSV